MSGYRLRKEDIPGHEPVRKRAVLYLRVSTAKQANKGQTEDGYSLPAQREACRRKAEELGADVVGEFIDRGESAKTTDRPEFQRMLARIRTERDVDYVILDKIDRFARNRRDDANLMFELKAYGAKLISVKENIDESPAGQLLHAIMAGIAEFYSTNLATEALKGMTQKAKGGGTPGRAPIGYLNIRERIDGREVRTIAVDPDRAQHVQWAFEAYASGEWTLHRLRDELAARGLRALPHGRNVPGPVQVSHVADMLKNRYYLGVVRFRGIEYPGSHQPIVTEYTFDRVQEVLAAHNTSGEKTQRHHHYLKGSVFCARCGSRLSLMRAKGRYLYFFCLGRHQRRTNCKQQYMPADDLEDAVLRHYDTLRLPEELKDPIREGIRVELDKQRIQAAPELKRARRRLTELDLERRRLARGLVTGAIPEDLARDEQARITEELAQAERILATAEVIFSHIEETLELTLELVGRVDDVYAAGGPRIRRLSNQFFFERILVHDGEVAGAVLAEPWSTMLAESFIERMRRNAANPGCVSSGRGSNLRSLVRLSGCERTPSPCDRAPSGGTASWTTPRACCGS